MLPIFKGLTNWNFFIDDIPHTYLHVDMLEQLVNCFLRVVVEIQDC